MRPSTALLSLLDKMERGLGVKAASCCRLNGVKFCANNQCPFYDTCPLTVKSMWNARKSLGSLNGPEGGNDATYPSDGQGDWGQESS